MEESGLLGSKHWVATAPPALRDSIRLYLNFDMIGSPNFIFGAHDAHHAAVPAPPGSAHPQALFSDFFAARGWNSTAVPFNGRSDYGPFIAVGIPANGVFTGSDDAKTKEEQRMFGGKAGIPYDKNYHLPRDDVANVHQGAFLMNARAIAHALATYSLSWEGVPPRNASVSKLPRRSAAEMPLVFGGGCGAHHDVVVNNEAVLPPGGVKEMSMGDVW